MLDVVRNIILIAIIAINTKVVGISKHYVARQGIVGRIFDPDALLVVRDSVVREHIVATPILQEDTNFVVRYVVVGDVAVTYAIKRYPRSLVSDCIFQREPSYIHILCPLHFKDVVVWVRCSHDAIRGTIFRSNR